MFLEAASFGCADVLARSGTREQSKGPIDLQQQGKWKAVIDSITFSKKLNPSQANFISAKVYVYHIHRYSNLSEIVVLHAKILFH